MFALLHQLWSDFYSPGRFWEMLALNLILAFAWWLSFRLRERDDRDLYPALPG